MSWFFKSSLLLEVQLCKGDFGRWGWGIFEWLRQQLLTIQTLCTASYSRTQHRSFLWVRENYQCVFRTSLSWDCPVGAPGEQKCGTTSGPQLNRKNHQPQFAWKADSCLNLNPSFILNVFCRPPGDWIRKATGRFTRFLVEKLLGRYSSIAGFFVAYEKCSSLKIVWNFLRFRHKVHFWIFFWSDNFNFCRQALQISNEICSIVTLLEKQKQLKPTFNREEWITNPAVRIAAERIVAGIFLALFVLQTHKKERNYHFNFAKKEALISFLTKRICGSLKIGRKFEFNCVREKNKIGFLEIWLKTLAKKKSSEHSGRLLYK